MQSMLLSVTGTPKRVKHKDGKQTAYFRGRKLKGEVMAVPEGYRGVVLKHTDRILHQNEQQRHIVPEDIELEVEDEGRQEDVKITEEIATFEEIMVWGHDRSPDLQEDPYAKGIQEWMTFAEAMHNPASDQAKKP